VIADGGELIIYAPHIREVSVHGKVIGKSAIIAAIISSHNEIDMASSGGLWHAPQREGHYDASSGVETPRITVTLATGILKSNAGASGYLDPASVNLEEWNRRGTGWSQAGRREMLYRTGLNMANGLFDLTGRVAVVIGATSGIGRSRSGWRAPVRA
jgi:hypothetical protein